jgi:hypothetical protein
MTPGMTNGIRLTCKDEDFKFLISKNGSGQNSRQGKDGFCPQTEKIMEEVSSDIHHKFNNQSSGSRFSIPNTRRKLIYHGSFSIQKNNSIKETFTGNALCCSLVFN